MNELIKCHFCKLEFNPTILLQIGGFHCCNSCIIQNCCECGHCGTLCINCNMYSRTNVSVGPCCIDNYVECSSCCEYFYCFNLDDFDDNNEECSECVRNRRYCEFCDSRLEVEDGDYCVNCSNKYWEAGKNVIGHTFNDIKSQIRYGIELEVSDIIVEKISQIKKNGVWGAKKDGTSGVHTEFYSPILQGDEGLDSIKFFCNLAKRFSVNDACGFHLHIDCTNFSAQQLKSIAIAYLITYDIWKLFVPRKREVNTYCRKDNLSISDYENSINFIDDIIKATGDRYCWANWVAYHKHSTLENRLHTGTIDYTKITNWIKANLRLVDWAKDRNIDEIKKYFEIKKEIKDERITTEEMEDEDEQNLCPCNSCCNERCRTLRKLNSNSYIRTSTIEELFISLSKIWNDSELTTYFLDRIDNFLETDSDRKFDFDICIEQELSLPVNDGIIDIKTANLLDRQSFVPNNTNFAEAIPF